MGFKDFFQEKANANRGFRAISAEVREKRIRRAKNLLQMAESPGWKEFMLTNTARKEGFLLQLATRPQGSVEYDERLRGCIAEILAVESLMESVRQELSALLKENASVEGDAGRGGEGGG